MEDFICSGICYLLFSSSNSNFTIVCSDVSSGNVRMKPQDCSSSQTKESQLAATTSNKDSKQGILKRPQRISGLGTDSQENGGIKLFFRYDFPGAEFMDSGKKSGVEEKHGHFAGDFS